MNVSRSTLGALLLIFLSFSASADFLRLEGGVGVFRAAPGGHIEDKNGGDISLEDAGIGTENDLYAWVYLKHPVPIIPNARLEYLALNHKPDGGGDFDVKEVDGILYYNLLDNLLFVTVDIGADVKYVETIGSQMGKATTLGLLYGRARVEPTDWLGIEAILTATDYQDNSGYDARLKVDYTMTFVPVIQPGLEVGYRIHKLQYKLGDVIDKAEYTGVYAGLMVRF